MHWRDGRRVYDAIEDKINPGKLALIGKCGHIAHPKCMATWYFTAGKCPTCRTLVDETFYLVSVDVEYSRIEPGEEIDRIRNLSYIKIWAKAKWEEFWTEEISPRVKLCMNMGPE